jgi:hypothetical protein
MHTRVAGALPIGPDGDLLDMRVAVDLVDEHVADGVIRLVDRDPAAARSRNAPRSGGPSCPSRLTRPPVSWRRACGEPSGAGGRGRARASLSR